MRIASFILFLLAVCAPGLTRGAAAQASGARVPDVRPAVERIDVVPGRPLVLPIEIVNERVLRRGEFEAVLDDGMRISGEIHWIGARPMPGATDRADWLGAAVEWVASPAGEAIRDEARPPGRWYMVCEMPREAVGLGMWFGGERSAVNWLPDPWRLGRDANGRVPESMWGATLPTEAAREPVVRRSLTRLASNPWTRWRARLMLGGLEPAGSFGDAWSAPVGVDPEELVGVLAKLVRYQDGLWQAAFARLWIGNQGEASALRARLGQVSAFRGGWAPSFPVSPVEELDLRTDLLNPFVNEKTLGIRAQAWRRSRPAAAVWVVDDAGRSDAVHGSPAATLGVVAFAQSPEGAATPASVLLSLEGLPPEPIESLREVQRVLPVRDASATGLRALAVPVRLGEWKSQVQVVRGLFPGAPPSVPVGPLVNDWTLGTWARGRELDGAASSPDSTTTARLLRAGRSSTDWQLLLECRSPSAARESPMESELGQAAADEVTCWFGPRGSPTVVRRVDRAGRVRGSDGDTVLQTLTVVETANGWAVMLPLPVAAIEPGELLRMGLTRTSGSGRRTAWPRRMLPWDREPGRLAIDLGAWDGM